MIFHLKQLLLCRLPNGYIVSFTISTHGLGNATILYISCGETGSCNPSFPEVPQLTNTMCMVGLQPGVAGHFDSLSWVERWLARYVSAILREKN